MAPPIPMPRPAPPRRSRSAADVLLGALAVLALIALTVGVPAALVTVVGLPLPHGLPSLSDFTQQIGITGILRILSVLVWLIWIQLLWCVIAEIRAAVRNAGMPSRVPLAGGTQQLVHRLVTSALLLVTATSALAPALVHHAPPAPPRQAAASASATPGAQRSRTETAVAAVRPADKYYIVKPPVGRYHESLWEIAQNHLGDGRRYPEIFELNSDRLQPDGSRLTISSLIRPGWVLRLPSDASGPGVQTLTPGQALPGSPAASNATEPGAAEHGAAEHGAPEHGITAHGAAAYGPAGGMTVPGVAGAGTAAQAPAGTPAGAAPGGTAGINGAGVNGAGINGAGANGAGINGAGANGAGTTGAGFTGAGTSSAGAAAGSSEARGRHAAAVAGPAQGYGLGFADELAAASLLAAGVLAALGRRRRVQLWQRAFGCQIATPDAEAAEAEAALRLGAHEPSTRLLDLGLRHLCRDLGQAGRTPPTVLAACLSDESLDLWIAPVDLSAPAPWQAAEDGAVWRLPWAALHHLDPGLVADTAAPFPGLVSIGTDSGGRVLVDLEAAHGLISVAGPPDTVLAALAAMAAELATSRWSDRMKITLVGFGADLVLLAPDRITAVRTLEEALPELDARSAAVASAMAASGIGSVLTGRSRGLNTEAWTPHYLIMATPPTPAQQQRLLELAAIRHAAAAGYVVAGEVPGATWTWRLTDEGQLTAAPLGLDVQAQLLPPRQQAAVVELFATAQRAAGPELDPLPPSTVPPAQLVPGSVMPVEVTLLGPVAVHAPGITDPDRLPVLTELVAYLATHPAGVHPTVLAGALWPRGVTTEVRDATFTRARDWLGTDPAGRPNLAAGPDGRIRLGDSVRVDWQVFQSLAALAARATRGPAGEADYLARALALVGGQLMTGRPDGRYAWLATDGLEWEVTARVADAAHRLATLRLTSGDPRGAMDAARTGLRLAYADELLWRDLLRGADATGDEKLVRAVVDGVYARIALDDVMPRLAPETEALIDEICPSWRASVA